MRVADPVMSSVPVMSIDTQAMKASAAAMAIQTPPSTGSGQQSDGVFGVLNKLPVKREEEDVARRQVKEVTKLLTGINSIAKRDGEVEERQLGLVKSVPEALGQATQVEKLVTSLPIKRDGSGILGGLGGLGGVLGGSVKRDVEGAEAHDETYTEKALKGFHGWMHHDSKDKQETPEIPSAADSLGLGGIAKRADPVNGLLDGVLAKRNDMESDNDMVDGLAKRDIDDAIATTSDALNSLAKRNDLNIRQLSVLSSMATGALSNAVTTAGKIGKIATGKHRRGNGDAGSIAPTATAGLNLGNHHKAGSDGDDESADWDDIAAEVAEEEQPLHDATSPKGHAGEHLDKRQVPPIAGSDALSIVKGLVANPSAALSPVTKGVLVGGTALGDMAPH